MRPSSLQLIPLIGLLLASAVSSAAPTYDRSSRSGGPNDQRVYSVRTDRSGNVAVTGVFYGALELWDGPLISAGYGDAFVAKFDREGNPLWSRSYGNDDWDSGIAVTTDSEDNLLVTGYFHGTVDFGNGPLASAGNEDIFLMKLDPNGNAVWARRFGDQKNQYPAVMQMDPSGDILVAGHFDGALDFGNGPLTSGSSTSIFLVKFDPGGNPLWSRKFAGTGGQVVCSLAVDGQGNIIVVGTFWGELDLGGGVLQGADQHDLFIAKLDADGNHVWSRRAGDGTTQVCKSVAVDSAGNILVGGENNGALDFGHGPLVSQGNFDIFLAKFDPAGHLLWDRGFGSESYEILSAVAMDPSGHLLVTGFFKTTLDLGGGPMVNTGADDLFLASFDTDGNHFWSRSYANATSSYGSSVTTDTSGGFLFAGGFREMLDLGAGPVAGGVPHGGFIVRMDSAGDLIWDRILGDPSAQAPRTGLGPNFPNPFSPSTTIQYSLATRARVVVDVFDVTGKLVARLDQGTRERGLHRATWNGNDGRGRMVEAGVYFYRLEGAAAVPPGKMILVR